MEPDWLTLGQAAKYLGVARLTVTDRKARARELGLMPQGRGSDDDSPA